MKIKYKLIILSTLGVLGMVFIAALGISELSGDGEAMHDVGEIRMPKQEWLLRLRGAMSQLARRDFEVAAKSMLQDFEEQKSELQRLQPLVKEAHDEASIAFQKYGETTFTDSAALEMWQAVKSEWGEWYKYSRENRDALDAALAHPSEADFQRVFKLIVNNSKARYDLTTKLQDELNALVHRQAEVGNKHIASAREGNKSAVRNMILIFVVGLVVLSVCSFSVVRQVIMPLGRARDVVTTIEQNLDLTQRLKIGSSDELGELGHSLDLMMERIQTIFRTIQVQVGDVSKIVGQVATSAGEVERSSASQSSSSSSMAASIEEMSVSINTVSGSAVEAQSMAKEAGSLSEQGSQIIEQVRDEMAAIAQIVSDASRVIKTLGDESQQITNVVNVIKEVADQTNLLALNAAIEAARAGEQGRGFAVVADEVRKLAERTAQSTQDISSMVGKIQGSVGNAVKEMGRVVSQVETGQSLTQKAGDRMQSIREEAVKVSSAITEISDALKEQSQASHDVARHVESIAQMTDQNSAAAAEAAENAKQLDRLAGEVKNALGSFKT